MEHYSQELTAYNAGLPFEEVESFVSIYDPFMREAKAYADKAEAIKIESVDDVEQMQAARKLRLQIKALRVDLEKKRKELKEPALLRSRAIDGLANLIKALIVPVERELEKKEKYAQTLEANRLRDLAIERKSLISPYINPDAFQDLAQLSGDEFSNLYEHLKLAHETKQKAHEEEKEKEARLKDELDQMERELDEMRVKEEMRKTEEMEERLRVRYEQENRLLEEKKLGERRLEEIRHFVRDTDPGTSVEELGRMGDMAYTTMKKFLEEREKDRVGEERVREIIACDLPGLTLSDEEVAEFREMSEREYQRYLAGVKCNRKEWEEDRRSGRVNVFQDLVLELCDPECQPHQYVGREQALRKYIHEIFKKSTYSQVYYELTGIERKAPEEDIGDRPAFRVVFDSELK